MPRLTRKSPKYSLHKPTGLAKSKYMGKTYYFGPYGTAASRQAHRDWCAGLEKSEPAGGSAPKCATPAGTVPLIGEAVLQYIAFARKKYCRYGVETGEATTIHHGLVPLTKRYAETAVDQFNPDMLEQLQEDMIKMDRSRGYVNKSCNIIRRFFKWCVKKRFVTAELFGSLKAVEGIGAGQMGARETEPVGPVADEIVQATLAMVSELVADVIRVMRSSGMRPSEAINMTPAELNRSDPSLWVYVPKRHKTSHRNKARIINLGPTAIEIIRRYLLKAGDRGKLFPLTRNALCRAITRGCRRAFPHPEISKIKPAKRTAGQKAELNAWDKDHHWHPNQLRHTYATEIRATHGLDVAQTLLGHEWADTTQIYAAPDLAKAQEVARKIG